MVSLVTNVKSVFSLSSWILLTLEGNVLLKGQVHLQSEPCNVVLLHTLHLKELQIQPLNSIMPVCQAWCTCQGRHLFLNAKKHHLGWSQIVEYNSIIII